MQNKHKQTSLFDIYSCVSQAMEENKPEIIRLLDEHIDWDCLIPQSFRFAFYNHYGRKHIYHLESFIKALVFQKFNGIPTDKLLIAFLKTSNELRIFCGFGKVPDASQFTRFRAHFCEQLKEMFERLVEMTEPVCRKIDAKKADYLIYDTTGIELPVCENNPKFLNAKLKAAKNIAKKNPDFNPYALAYSMLPDTSKINPDAKQQYINGHFCYSMKIGILTNGLGIPRHIEFLDDDFKKKHLEIVEKKSDAPDIDKEIADATSLIPVLSNFFVAHPFLSYKTFIGDAAFDSYQNYTELMTKFKFQRACIPINRRNTQNSDVPFDAKGTPVCPIDGTPFTFLGKSGGQKRALRYKWVCHCSVKNGNTRICTCEHPCTNSKYGRCVYTYQNQNFRICPGIQRNTDHWKNLYKHRTTIERTINLLKDTFVLDARRSTRSVSAKADTYLAGITQLCGVLLANSIHELKLYKSIRKLLA